MKTIKFLLLAALVLTYTISTYGQDKSHYMPKFAIKTMHCIGLPLRLTLDLRSDSPRS